MASIVCNFECLVVNTNGLKVNVLIINETDAFE